MEIVQFTFSPFQENTYLLIDESRQCAIVGIIFIFSFIGVLAQFSYNFFLANSMEIYGPGGLIMPIMVIVFGGFLIYYSRMMKAKGVLK